MSQLPVWAQWTQFAVAVVLTIFAAYIAYRQWRTAHLRVVLDLFERRMAVYDEARAVIGEIMRDGTATNPIFFRYAHATDRLGLLFGDDVVAYSDKVRDRINKLIYHETMIRAQMAGTPVENYGHHVDEATRLLTELSKFYDEFSALISPYVRMTQKQASFNWKKPTRGSRIDIAGSK